MTITEKYLQEHYKYTYELFSKSSFTNPMKGSLMDRLYGFMDWHDFYYNYLPYYSHRDTYLGYVAHIKTADRKGTSSIENEPTKNLNTLKKQLLPSLLNKFEEFVAFGGLEKQKAI